jgi:hypothetical protein
MHGGIEDALAAFFFLRDSQLLRCAGKPSNIFSG